MRVYEAIVKGLESIRVDTVFGGAWQFCEQWVLNDGATGWQTLILA